MYITSEQQELNKTKQRKVSELAIYDVEAGEVAYQVDVIRVFQVKEIQI
jgi:hypothetical protein